MAEGTTHFAVVDSAGNIVCATQPRSLHFGAGGDLAAPGGSRTGYADPRRTNAAAGP